VGFCEGVKLFAPFVGFIGAIGGSGSGPRSATASSRAVAASDRAAANAALLPAPLPAERDSSLALLRALLNSLSINRNCCSRRDFASRYNLISILYCCNASTYCAVGESVEIGEGVGFTSACAGETEIPKDVIAIAITVALNRLVTNTAPLS